MMTPLSLRGKILALLAITALVVALPVILYLQSQQQELRSKAADPPCIASGGNGGTTSGIPGVVLRGGDGGDGSNLNGVCKPGTQGYSLNATSYCTTQDILITWPATNTATYYRLQIDGTQVYNGTALSFNAHAYSVGPQHTVILTAGNTTVGDFDPSTNGFFQIQNTACTAPTPTQTPTPLPPTVTPTPIPPTLTPTLTGTPTPPPPTLTLTPTPTPAITRFALTLLLHGIGNSGDSANETASSLSNQNPKTTTRPVTVDVFTSNPTTGQITAVTSKTGTVTFQPATGNFMGTIAMGTILQNQTYLVKVKTEKYLRRTAGIPTVTAGTTIQLPQVTLIAGDAFSDNSLDVLDYNLLYGCYSGDAPARNCTTEQKFQADLNDDGNVNQYDYNLFLRELGNRTGE